MIIIPVLYTRRDSIYKKYPFFDPYDDIRDARTYNGNMPVIAHPPCATWGRLSHLAKQQTHDLGYHALQIVDTNGGVIEHPAATKLYKNHNGSGFILSVNQSWFGHKCQKRTWLYINGISPSKIPPYPLSFELVTTNIEKLSKKQREHTPEAFALWLYDLALAIAKNKGAA